jgi:hypothetical protein
MAAPVELDTTPIQNRTTSSYQIALTSRLNFTNGKVPTVANGSGRLPRQLGPRIVEPRLGHVLQYWLRQLLCTV